ncbi:hypothetical protein LSCM1_02742 [Leishmania martiniquensis]|uniref:TBC1 domain family member 23 n=1 Tax=Leishmania martiniquensis TaxID=1580590 RepID=A0A836KAQ2_9TRYP|nr:hypothetical protein LSCM1_02742 [Leishmania martiniquensis]
MSSSETTKDAAAHAPEVEAAPTFAPPSLTAELAEGVAVAEGAPDEKMGDAESAAATAAEATSSPQSPGESKIQSALAALVQLLDSDSGNAETARRRGASLPHVQRMCMRVPQLSNVLTRSQRFQLYCLLLLDDTDGAEMQSEVGEHEDWAVYTQRALEEHVQLAEQAVALFPATLHVTADELAGLFCRLDTVTAFNFNAETSEVVLCVTYVVAGSCSTEKDVLLRTLYRLLCVLQKDFLVPAASRLYEPAAASLLRLMLQFFDPRLATHMDQQQVDAGRYMLEWSRRLLVLQSDYDAALKVLDWVFILGDPAMIPYVAHAYLITHRRSLMALSTKQELTQHLDKMRFTLPACKADAIDPGLVDGRATAPTCVWSGKSLLQNADLLYRITPLSAQRMLDFCLYPDVGLLNKTPEELQQYYAQTPSLPLERFDIASAFAKRSAAADGGKDLLPSREYIIVDCRSQESFEYVRLPTAILVGDVLGYEQEGLAEAMRRLESCRGHPLALFATGRPIVEEVNLLKVFALYLVNREAFPFVCIVPGGFKTTIPLLRNHVIDVIMSPAATAALQSATGKRGLSSIDWAQQASDTAHAISAAFSGVSDYLAKIEGMEVRQKALELRTKAQTGVAAAGSWGWGVMQRFRDSLGETRAHASAVLSAAGDKLASTQTTASASSSAAPSFTDDTGPFSVSAPSATSQRLTRVKAAAPAALAHAAASQPSQQPQQAFSLGEYSEEEDLDLITSIPTRPLRGVVVTASALPASETALSAPAAAPSSITVSTPERQYPPAPAPSLAATTMAGSREQASPPAASAPSPAAKAARTESASRIAASIDAEFDELFSDLALNPETASPPSKPTTSADADGLFGP